MKGKYAKIVMYVGHICLAEGSSNGRSTSLIIAIVSSFSPLIFFCLVKIKYKRSVCIGIVSLNF